MQHSSYSATAAPLPARVWRHSPYDAVPVYRHEAACSKASLGAASPQRNCGSSSHNCTPTDATSVNNTQHIPQCDTPSSHVDTSHRLSEADDAPVSATRSNPSTDGRVTDIAAVVRQVRDRAVALCHQQRSADGATCEADTDGSPFAGPWIDGYGDPRVCSVAPLYVNTAKFNDEQYVREHLKGVTFDRLQALDDPIDQLLFKFLLYRRFDVESAAERFLAFRGFVVRAGLSVTINIDDPDVRAGIRLAALHHRPEVEDDVGRVVFANIPRHFDWEAVAPPAMLKAWFYMTLMILSWSPTVQTHGAVLCASLLGSNLLEPNAMELQLRINEASLQGLPARLAAGYMANSPVPPQELFQTAEPGQISRRVKDLFKFVGTSYDRVLRHVPAHCVPVEMGGTRILPAPGQDDWGAYDHRGVKSLWRS
jgi:hypothetical protein